MNAILLFGLIDLTLLLRVVAAETTGENLTEVVLDDGDEDSEEWIGPRVYNPTLSYRSWREQFIARKLLESYKGNIRPRGTNESHPKDMGGPVVVYTTVNLRALNSINDANMEFSAQFRFIQEWFDSRLEYEHMGFREIDYVNLAYDQFLKLWIPDTFFQNEKRGHYHYVDQINAFTRVKPDGTIVYNRRLSMTFSCTMDLLRYPHDTQTCQMDFATYAYTTDDIMYIWSPQAVIITEATSAMLPKFIIISVTNSTCTSKTNTGEYSCLRVQLVLKRVFSFFLLQLYIPSIMLVAVSCVSYWIDWKASPARVPLSIVTLLTMITQSHSINSSLPPVSYTKAIDLWIGSCIVFIFCSLLEYAFVNFTGVREERRKAKQREREKRQNFSLGQAFYASAFATAGPSGESTILPLSAMKREISGTLGLGPENPPNKQMNESIRRDRRVGNAIESDHAANVMVTFGSYSDPVEDHQTERKRNRRFISTLPLCRYIGQRGKAERIDVVARILFPISFICFNIVYWTLYW